MGKVSGTTVTWDDLTRYQGRERLGRFVTGAAMVDLFPHLLTEWAGPARRHLDSGRPHDGAAADAHSRGRRRATLSIPTIPRCHSTELDSTHES